MRRTPSSAPVEQLVRRVLNPLRASCIRGAAARRVVLEAAVLRWIVRRRDDDPVGEPGRSAAVVAEDGVGDDRGRRVAVAVVDHHVDFVRRQHLERGRERRLGQRVGVDAEEERTIDALLAAIEADRLGDGQDVRLVERRVEGRAAVAGRPERDPLRQPSRDRAEA